MSESGQQYTFVVESELKNWRIDRYITGNISDCSRNRAAEMVETGLVLVNGSQVKKNHRLSTGDMIQVIVPEPEPVMVKPQAIPLDVLYEDQEIIVVNKPRGMVVHPAPGNPDGTLVNALLAHCDDLSGINGVLRPGIVHRIDKDTTGILVVAKTDASHKQLASQFKKHTIIRRYTALLFGVLLEPGGMIDAPIGRDPRNRKRMAVNLEHGKRAVTRYEVVSRYEKMTCVKLKLETGRTHQIRVHMAYLGHPVVGDSLYSTKRSPFLEVTGQLLHAGFLAFEHPGTGRWLTFEVPPPNDFQQVLDQLDAGGLE